MRIAPTALLLAVLLPAAVDAQDSIDGFTEPSRKADLSPAETGILSQLLVKEGDRVTKGQVLAILDSEVQEAALKVAELTAEARGRLEAAIAERNLKQFKLEKLRELRSRSHASQDEVDRAATELAMADANVLNATEQKKINALECDRARAAVERRIVRSPIDGVVLRIRKEVQEFVNVSPEPLITVADLDVLRVTFGVPTDLAMNLRAGQEVILKMTEPSVCTKGTIEYVSPVTDAESNTVRVKVLVDSSRGELRVGVSCTLEVPAGSQAEVVTGSNGPAS